MANGDVLELWTNQFFDLLPGEIADCDVEVRTRDGAFSGPLTLIGELNGRTEMEHYEFTADRSARN